MANWFIPVMLIQYSKTNVIYFINKLMKESCDIINQCRKTTVKIIIHDFEKMFRKTRQKLPQLDEEHLR